MANIGIFVGSVYGNSAAAAENAASILNKQGHTCHIFDEGTLEDWKKYGQDDQHVILIITSTTGMGDIPDSIDGLFEGIKQNISAQATLKYGIIAIGDSNFDDFCAAGHAFDDLLQMTKAQRIGDLVEIDVSEQGLDDVIPEIVTNWGSLI